jgi:hypothetical protein
VSGDEERDFGAGFECHLAVVRAIVMELSPRRYDGAPRGLDASTRDRGCTTMCGTFALGLGTSPEDAPGPFGAHAHFWLSSRRGLIVAATRHRSAFRRFFLLGAAQCTVVQPCATDQRPKRTSSAAAGPKAAASNFAPPAQVDNDAKDGVSAGHLRRCDGAAAGAAAAASIAHRKAGTARRPSTRARWREVGDTREPTLAAMIYDAGRRRLRRVRHVVLHDDREAGLLRLARQGARRQVQGRGRAQGHRGDARRVWRDHRGAAVGAGHGLRENQLSRRPAVPVTASARWRGR